MSTTNKKVRTHHKTRNKYLLVSFIGLVAIIACTPFVVGFIIGLCRNEAAEAAAPIDAALLRAGMHQACTNGDPGTGGDNISPWYTSSYEFDGNHDQALAILKKVASDNGYNLRGPLGVAELQNEQQYTTAYSDSSDTPSYISGYLDATSKRSSYNDLSSGFISLSFELYNGSASGYSSSGVPRALSCGLSTLRADTTHTAILLHLTLSSRKLSR